MRAGLVCFGSSATDLHAGLQDLSVSTEGATATGSLPVTDAYPIMS
jgi:hypothetical protein